MLEEAYNKTVEYLEVPDVETGEAPEGSRLKDAASLRAIWDNFRHGDETGAYNRTLVRQLLDGRPPFDQAEREEDGQGDLFNVNTGHGRLIVDGATSGLMDIFNSDRTLVRIPLSQQIPQNERNEWERKIEFRFTEMLRNWDSFTPRVTNLCFTDAADGIATAFFENDETWKFGTAGLAEMKFPRYSEPVSTLVPVAVLRKNMNVGELWRKIQNEEEAKEEGWNRDAVIKAIHHASKSRENNWQNWEKLQEDLKANEAYVSSVADPIEVLFGFVEEFNGKVSFFAATADSESKVNDFLLQKEFLYENQNEAFQIFPYSTGTNNRLYTIRGMGYFVYQAANAENIMFSNLMNAARVNGFPQYQYKGTEELEDASFHDMGFGLMLPPGIDLPERQQGRDLKQSILPALDVINKTLVQNSGGLSGGALAFGERATQSNISASLEQLNKMNAFAISLFYPPLDRLYREMVRRVFIKKVDTPETKEMFRLLIEEDGVPAEILDRVQVSKVQATRVLGGGSKANRINTLAQVRQLYPTFDEQGKKESDYDYIAELAGEQYAMKYVGEVNKSRKVIDAKIAELENASMLDGAQLDPHDGENHLVHLREHLEEMLAGQDGVETGQVELENYVLRNLQIWEHAQKHLAMLSVDESMEREANEITAQIQRLGEYFSNGIKAINAQRKKDGVAVEGGSTSGDQERENDAFIREQRRKDMEVQAEIQRKNTESQAEIALKDAEQAAKLRRG